MTPRMAFPSAPVVDQEMEELSELDRFFSSPQSIGLDNVRESLRNVVQLMMELKGYATGYAIQNLVFATDLSLAMDGVLPGDDAKNQRIKDFWQRMYQLHEEMQRRIKEIFSHVATKIIDVKQSIDAQIERLDKEIEAAEEAPGAANVVQEKKTKKRRLLGLRRRVEEREEQLQEADTAQEIIEVEQALDQDIQSFNTTEKVPGVLKKLNPLGIIGTAMQAVREDVEAAEPDRQGYAALADSTEKPYRIPPYPTTAQAGRGTARRANASGGDDSGSGDDKSGGGGSDTDPLEPL